MESGIETANIMIATIDTPDNGQTFTCDKTVAEIKAFLEAGGRVFAATVISPYHLIPLWDVPEVDGAFVVQFVDNIISVDVASGDEAIVTIARAQIDVSRGEGSETDLVYLSTNRARMQATAY